MPFPKSYRTGLAWTVSAGAIIALIAGQRTLTCTAIIVLVICGASGIIWAAWEHQWVKTKSRACLISAATVVGMFLLAWMAWPLKTVPTPELQPIIAVFAKCDLIGFPIEILPQNAIRIVPINERGMKSISWGSFEIRNDTKKTTQWPEKAKMQQAARQHDLGVFAYKCEVGNHGGTNLFDVAMPMRFWFGDKVGEENALKYTPIISPLDAGHSFPLYFVNDCPTEASGILLENATVRVAGETMRRTTKLNLPNRNSADPIMFWPPTKIRWVNSTRCE